MVFARHIGLYNEDLPSSLLGLGTKIKFCFLHYTRKKLFFKYAVNNCAKVFGTIRTANLTATFGMPSNPVNLSTLIFLAFINSSSLLISGTSSGSI